MTSPLESCDAWAMPTFDSRYESAIRTFVQAIRQLAREELAEQLKTVVGKGGARLAAAKAGRGAAASTGRGRAKGAKRSSSEIATAVAKVKAAIGKAPGSRSEELVPLVGLRKEDVADAIARLLADKEIRKRGVKRATKYFPVGE